MPDSLTDSSQAAGPARSVPKAQVLPIGSSDIPDVADFLHATMGSKTSAADWRHSMSAPWDVEQPNHGFHMRADGRVVGAYLALYSERVIDGQVRRICNLAAWSVAEPHRATGLRLLRALLRQKGFTFTDLTPNPNVVTLNSRLGFAALDTTTALVVNVPLPLWSRGVRVLDRPAQIESVLSGADSEIYRDHMRTAARHAVITDGVDHCYVIYRREWYKHLPLFATVLFVGNSDVFRRLSPHFYRYLFLRKGIPATLVETRVVGHRPRRSKIVPGRTRMYLSEDLDPEQIDYLYSELTCLT